MPPTFGIIDLFAGPGGLGEGFASLTSDGHRPFRIGISVEKEASAHRTLTLRSFLRAYRARHDHLPNEFINFHAGLIDEPDWSSVDREAWQLATEEARCLELGSEAATEAIEGAITRLKREFDDTILIGGPPCQAYSLVGRARSKGNRNYVPEKDERHYLFREYIRVLDRLRPAAFVMENVKGMLSSTVESRLVFEMLMEDLSSLGTGKGYQYELRAIRVEDGTASLREARQSKDFVVRAEEFGVPQRRHRVIIIGTRKDLAAGAGNACIDLPASPRTVDEVLSDSGSCYISGDLAEWLEDHKMDHVRGAPFHPQTQGKIERWHQTMKNRVLLENYYLPGDLERQIGAFVDYNNNARYHESLGNVTPADVYFGRDKDIIREREKIKKQTIQKRRLQHQKQAA